MIFRYSELRDFYLELKRLGPIKKFQDWDGSNSFLIRHDVDLDIELAYELARFEADLGIASTYFILPSCPCYNIMSQANKTWLREMVSMGHEIALHFDPSIYDSDLETAMRNEADLLTLASGQPVKSVSLHNPSMHGQYPMFEGMMNAYDPRIFGDDRYLSDSRMDFRGKDPMEFIQKIKDSPIQILLHPLHYSESGGGYDHIVTQTLSMHIDRVDDYFRKEFKSQTYVEQVGDDLRGLIKGRL